MHDPAPPAAASVGVPDFAPARLRYRRDGWTPERQRAFIAALWECRCTREACRRVGRSPEAAYKLYRRSDAASFRRAWDAALSGPKPPRASTSGQQWHVSDSQASSTSGPSTSGPATPGPMAPPPDKPRCPLPPYSLDAFARAVRRPRPGEPRP